jgi:hypothetical protein
MLIKGLNKDFENGLEAMYVTASCMFFRFPSWFRSHI